MIQSSEYTKIVQDEALKLIDTVQDRIQRGILETNNLFTNEFTD